MQNVLQQGRTAWAGFPRRAQLAIVGVAIVTCFVMFLVVRASTSTSWVPVTEAGMSTAKLGEAQNTLEAAGFPTQMSETGGMIEVAKDNSSKASAALMEAGIAAKGDRTECSKQFGSGGSMMSKTSQETAILMETCQENQAANDIERIQGVESANVDVTMADNGLFSAENSPAKAAVSLDTGGSPLPAKAVMGIQKSVAAKFEGLASDAVVVSDETGSDISGADGAAGMAGDEDTLKLRTEATKNQEIEKKLTSTLEKIVGKGNVVVTSNVQLDMDKITRNVLENKAAGADGAQLVDNEGYEKELLNGAAAEGVQGVAGTGSNTGTAAIDTDNRTLSQDLSSTKGTSDGDYLGDKGTIQYANNKVGEVIGVRPGTVLSNRLGVVVDEGVSESSKNAVKNAVQAWMGGNAEDSFSFDQAQLASSDEVAKPQNATATAIAGYLKWALLGFGLIGMAFVMRRALTQRTAELLAPADDLLLLEPGDFTPIPIAELEAALAASQPSHERVFKQEMQRKVETIADTKPEDVANELRRWMHQEMDGGFSSSATSRRAH